MFEANCIDGLTLSIGTFSLKNDQSITFFISYYAIWGTLTANDFLLKYIKKHYKIFGANFICRKKLSQHKNNALKSHVKKMKSITTLNVWYGFQYYK